MKECEHLQKVALMYSRVRSEQLRRRETDFEAIPYTHEICPESQVQGHKAWPSV